MPGPPAHVLGHFLIFHSVSNSVQSQRTTAQIAKFVWEPVMAIIVDFLNKATAVIQATITIHPTKVCNICKIPLCSTHVKCVGGLL